MAVYHKEFMSHIRRHRNYLTVIWSQVPVIPWILWILDARSFASPGYVDFKIRFISKGNGDRVSFFLFLSVISPSSLDSSRMFQDYHLPRRPLPHCHLPRRHRQLPRRHRHLPRRHRHLPRRHRHLPRRHLHLPRRHLPRRPLPLTLTRRHRHLPRHPLAVSIILACR